MKSFDKLKIENGSVDISAKKHRKKSAQELQLIDNRSFLALLIRSFVSFMAIAVVSIVALYFFATWANQSDKINIDVHTIANYRSELEDGRYSSVPISRIFGRDGWLDIVDMDGNVIYSSSSEEHTYTLGELDCILSYGSGETVRALRFLESDTEYSYVITKTFDNGTPDQYQLLNSELRIVSGTISTLKGQYTEREFELLIYNSSHNGVIMERYAFSSDGKDYYAVYLDTTAGSGVPQYVFFIIFALGVIAMMITVVVLYIRYINRHVQKPLKALGEAMTEFAGGRFRANLIFHGTKEFEQLVDSFNEMVELLNATEQQRNELEQDKQRMLAGLSHDLKTPMTVIQGFSKAIRDGLVSEEDMPKYLNLIIAKSEHMSELINEFYEYSKLEHPDFNLTFENVDVAELVRTYLAGRYDEFGIRNREIEADITEDVLGIDGDKGQLVRVLENLVNNFFKYTPDGSTLYVSVDRAEGMAHITVGDNGGGISDDVKGDIFSPFVVGEQSRNNQGSGLGLAVCKKIIEAHGGSIKLSDTPNNGNGLEFSILLPLKKNVEME